MDNNITFIGGGSFGTALGIMLAKKGLQVKIWDRKPEIIHDFNIKKKI
ncbi:NAD(P)H-dependent glycerol-3-phosphate dehydrogenase [Clostridium tetanomorphum]|nr:NAD(P)H-dependent glycerol-3-phosphate dehydrogenase [Clostridium tetanomorphum]